MSGGGREVQLLGYRVVSQGDGCGDVMVFGFGLPVGGKWFPSNGAFVREMGDDILDRFEDALCGRVGIDANGAGEAGGVGGAGDAGGAGGANGDVGAAKDTYPTYSSVD